MKKIVSLAALTAMLAGCADLSTTGKGAAVSDGFGGDEDEYVMLRLRLSEGLIFEEYERKFGVKIKEDKLESMKKYEKAGLLVIDDLGIRLTPEGFLLSNMIIGEMLE